MSKEEDKDLKLRLALTRFSGIGLSRAQELIDQGVNKVSDLKKEEIYNALPEETKMEVKYLINTRIPWKVADEFVSLLPKSFMALGSYRRKKPYLGDLDLLTLDEMSVAVKKFESLKGFRIMSKYVGGKIRTSYVVRFKSMYIKTEIFHTEKENLPAAILHWTGSMFWNIRCRVSARRKGYLLNEKGLFKDDERIPVRSERDILEIIGVKYLPPEQRER